eukprot:TRINITY_DN115_c0_g1_i3.p1 TRINITY_DN115_c0_g1~~TRINITY_DN115_c0_g1_i3.p1  ORF type:complete len:272 (-),score=70.82 TRINITY_DN115_c0_g1_i3:70-885(-)
MNSSQILLLTSVLLLTGMILSAPTPNGQVRYANSLPQFGNAKIQAFLPISNVFQSVPGGFLTSYTKVPPRDYVFTAEFPTSVSALSNPKSVKKDKFYSLFTYQEGDHFLNKLIEDRAEAFDTSSPVLRTINLVQYDFPLNIFNGSSNDPVFSNVTYGDATEYRPVPAGEYQLHWEFNNQKKRGLEQWNFNISGVITLLAGKAYTNWVLSTGSFIVQDGVVSGRKRSVSAERTIVRKARWNKRLQEADDKVANDKQTSKNEDVAQQEEVEQR